MRELRDILFDAELLVFGLQDEIDLVEVETIGNKIGEAKVLVNKLIDRIEK